MGKVAVGAAVVCAAAVCAAVALVVRHRIQSSNKWARAMAILRDFEEKCGTPLVKLRQVADADLSGKNVTTIIRKTTGNMLMQNLLERLRPLVGFNGWDYCVLWNLSQDQRYIEWTCCCCGGAESINQNDAEELHFPAVACRDTIIQHPRSNPCHLLASLPCSMPLDSDIYTQTLLSNQPKWLNLSCSSDSTAIELEIAGTKVLIPVAFGIIELFVAKQISEDEQVIDFVKSQYNVSMEQEAMVIINVETDFSVDQKDLTDQTNYFHPQLSPATLENLNLNFVQQCHLASDSRTKNMTFHEGLQEIEAFQKSLMHNTSDIHMQIMENLENKEMEGDDDKVIVKLKNGRLDSLSDCSDQIDDDDDVKCHRRNEQEYTAKNLMAERKRRKKLNDRLYELRSLVPKISKLDRAAILGDAIDFIKELEQQAKELEDELQQRSDDIANNGSHSIVQADFLGQNGATHWPNQSDNHGAANNYKFGTQNNGKTLKPNQDSESTNEKSRQMEPQVEVAQIGDNEFFVKVFCEKKRGAFMRLMEAFNSLGMEVSNANVTSYRGLVSNVFKVSKKDSGMVQAEHVRDSLLEITRNPTRGWPKMDTNSSENGC